MISNEILYRPQPKPSASDYIAGSLDKVSIFNGRGKIQNTNLLP